MRILVTGHAGFVGAAVVRAVAERGDQALGLDIRKATDGLAGRLEYGWRCDIRDQVKTQTAIHEGRPAVVIHLAARTDQGGRDLADYSANTAGLRVLLEACRSVGCVRMFVLVSTQLVCRLGLTPASNLAFSPDTLYGQSKTEGEQILRATAASGMAWVIVRPTTVWGPGMSEHYLRLFRSLARGYYFHVGSTPLRKSYGYLGNTAHQLVKLATASSDLVHGRVFYVADYEPITLQDWLDSIAVRIGGPRIPTIPVALGRGLAAFGDVIDHFRPGSVPFNSIRLRNILTEYVFDLEATRAVCGDLPFSLEEGLDELVVWLRRLGVTGRNSQPD